MAADTVTVTNSAAGAHKASYQKYYPCSDCGLNFRRLGNLHRHIQATKHMCVRCQQCDRSHMANMLCLFHATGKKAGWTQQAGVIVGLWQE